MKKRTAFIGAIFSLIPLGQPLLIGTGAALTSSALMLISSQKVKAESGDYYYNRGIEKDNRGDYYGAIEDYTKAIEINPRDLDAFFNRATSKEMLGDYKGAISDYTQVLKINPKDTGAFLNRTFLKETLGDNKGAFSDYAQFIKINPSNADAYYNRALLKESLKDIEGAISDYTQTIKINSKYTDAYYNRALLKNTLKDYKGALSDFTKVIKINSKDADAYWNRSIVKETIGDFRSAVDDQNKALKFYSKKKINLSVKDIVDTSNLNISKNSLKKSVLKTAGYNGESFQIPIKYFIHDKNEKIKLRERKYGYEISNDTEKFIVDTFLKIDSLIDIDFQRVYSPKEASIRIYKTKMPGDNIAQTIQDWNSRKYGVDIIWGESEKIYPKLKKYPSLSADNAFSIIHEIGHALGLSHQESSCRKICKYNIDPNDKTINSRDTVMSYNNFLYPREVVFFTKFDIDALRNLWGVEKEN